MLAGRRTQRLLSLRSATGTPTTKLPRRLPRGSTPLTAGCGLLLRDRFAASSEMRMKRFYFFPLHLMANASPQAQRPASNQDATSSAKPVATMRYGSISAAVFRNPVKTKSGETVYSYTVSLRRSYQQNGKWAQTHTLRENDLLAAAYALDRCCDFITEARGADLEAESEQ